MATWYEELAKHIEANGGCREIWRRENGDDKLYLRRFYIYKTKESESMLHQFFLGDRGPLHNHPWPNSSLVLKTGYWEWMRDGKKYWRSEGYSGNRGATTYHKVELEPGTAGNVWTLFTTGKRVRKWDFLDNNVPIPFDEFLKKEGVENITLPEQYTNGLFPRKIG